MTRRHKCLVRAPSNVLKGKCHRAMTRFVFSLIRICRLNFPPRAQCLSLCWHRFLRELSANHSGDSFCSLTLHGSWPGFRLFLRTVTVYSTSHTRAGGLGLEVLRFLKIKTKTGLGLGLEGEFFSWS